MTKKTFVGITGGIGAGKSIVCRIINTMGYPVFYSDIEAKKILNSDSQVISALKTIFGKEAYSSNAELNRNYISEKIFSNQSLLNSINDIVHPAVRKAFHDWADEQEKEIVFNEAAILFETNAYKKYHINILVTAPEKLRLKRVMQRDSTTEEAIKARMLKQWSDEKKKKIANLIIKNDDQILLIPQVINLLKECNAFHLRQ